MQDLREELDIVQKAVEAHEAQWEAIHTAKSHVLDGYEKRCSPEFRAES